MLTGLSTEPTVAMLPDHRTALLPEWLIPIEPQGKVLQDHALVMQGALIEAILPVHELQHRYPHVQRCALPGQALLPGLVNLHAHAAMTLLRGYADDFALMDWLTKHIWPAEARWVSDAFVEDGTALACAEFVRGGVTTFNDMYFFPEAAARAVISSGLRATLGITVLEFPTTWATDADDYLRKGLAARDLLRDEPRLNFAMAPHAPYTVGDATFRRVMTFADELDLPVHLHVHETTTEIDDSLRQHGVRPIERLARLGVLDPRLIAVHAVHLTPGEIDLLAAHGVSVAHCPHSNLKLASGIAPLHELRAAGVNVGIGTDGAASNNRLDVLAETRTAGLLAKGASGQAGTLPAAELLTLATLGGARALGLAAQIGSLQAGKQADLISIQLDMLDTLPLFDAIAQVVYSAGREQVRNVWVAGEALLHDRRLVKVDAEELRSRALAWGRRLQAR